MRTFLSFSVIAFLTILGAAVGDLAAASSANHLENLDDFSLLGVFDWLHVCDLVKLATLNARFRQIIEDHYITAKYRLQTHEILIILANTVTIRYKNDKNFFTPIVHKHDEVLLLLRNFGHIFSHLSVEIESAGYKYVEEIQFIVNTHCSKAFQKILLRRDGCNAVENVNISFPNVVEVFLLHTEFEPIDPIRLDIAFPRMQKLSIDRDIDLTNHYPHLTDIIFPTNYEYLDNMDLSGFMRLNPQLRRIESPIFDDVVYLKSVSEFLPNLDSLSLGMLTSQYTISSFPIARFKHVKKFSLDLSVHGNLRLWTDKLQQILGSLQFNQLASFSVHLDESAPLDFLIEMIVRNTQLQNLLIYSELKIEQFSRLFASLPELKELTFSWHRRTTQATLNRILEFVVAGNHMIERITVQYSNHFNVTNEEFVEFLPRGWSCNEASATKKKEKLLQLERLL